MQFYEEFSDIGKRQSTGNVVTIFPETRARNEYGVYYEGLIRSFPYPLSLIDEEIPANGPVTDGTISDAYLSRYCRPVSVSQAQQIHPRLFEDAFSSEEIAQWLLREQQRRLFSFLLTGGAAMIGMTIFLGKKHAT